MNENNILVIIAHCDSNNSRSVKEVLSRDEVKDVLRDYRDPLTKCFKYYAALDKTQGGSKRLYRRSIIIIVIELFYYCHHCRYFYCYRCCIITIIIIVVMIIRCKGGSVHYYYWLSLGVKEAVSTINLKEFMQMLKDAMILDNVLNTRAAKAIFASVQQLVT